MLAGVPPTPKVGERWVNKGTRATWRVTFVSDTEVGMSGPGPMRSYRKMALNDFLAMHAPLTPPQDEP